MKVKIEKIIRKDMTKNGNRRYLILATLGDGNQDVFTVITRSESEDRLMREGNEIDIIPVRNVPYILNGIVENDEFISKFVG